MPRAAAGPDHAAVTAGDSVLIDVLANDVHLGPDLQIIQVAQPAHGTLIVEGDKLRYTAPAGDAALTVRGGYSVASSNGTQGMASVTVSILPPTPTLTLKGRVPGIIPTCSLVVHAGSEQYSGCVDASGAFEVDIVPGDSADLVRIEATAQLSAQGPSAPMVSVLGTRGDLFAHGGEARTLSWQDAPGLTLTPVTTALAAAVINLNGGELPQEIERVSMLESLAEPSIVWPGAGVYRGVLAGTIPLPAGHADAFLLLQDSNAVTQARWAHPEALQAQSDILLGEVQLLAPFPHTFADRLASTMGGDSTSWRLGASTLDYHMHFNAGGSGTVISAFGTDNAAMTWSRSSDGSLAVVQAQATPQWAVWPMTCESPPPFSTQVVIERGVEVERVVRLAVGQRFSLVIATGSDRVTNVGEIPPGCVVSNPSLLEDRPLTHVSMFVSGADTLDFGPTAAIPAMALALRAPWTVDGSRPRAEEVLGGVLDVAAGAVDMPGLTGEASVEPLPDGRLRVTLQAEASAGGESITLTLARSKGELNGAEEWTVDSETSLGIHASDRSVVVPVADTDHVFTPGALAGDWATGFDLSRRAHVYEGQQMLYWRIAGTQPARWEQWVVTGQSPSLNRTFFPAEQGNGWFAPSFRHEGVDYPECPVSYCVAPMARQWVPLSEVEVDGVRRLYVLESIWAQILDGEWVRLAPVRINFIQERAMPPTAQPLGAPVNRARAALQ